MTRHSQTARRASGSLPPLAGAFMIPACCRNTCYTHDDSTTSLKTNEQFLFRSYRRIKQCFQGLIWSKGNRLPFRFGLLGRMIGCLLVLAMFLPLSIFQWLFQERVEVVFQFHQKGAWILPHGTPISANSAMVLLASNDKDISQPIFCPRFEKYHSSSGPNSIIEQTSQSCMYLEARTSEVAGSLTKSGDFPRKNA